MSPIHTKTMEEYLSVRCPYCNMSDGLPCISLKTGKRTKLHGARRDYYLMAQQRFVSIINDYFTVEQ